MNDILSALKSNIVKDIVPSMTFFGMFEDGREYGPGSITIKDGVPTLFNGEFWDPIELSASENTANGDTDMVDIKAMKCNCCGAGLIKMNGRIVCEYCGTEYKENRHESCY